MKIALIGYGKMGHRIEQAARKNGHEIAATLDVAAPDATIKLDAHNPRSLSDALFELQIDGAIEFSNPASAVQNMKTILPLGIPLVVGTTGWYDSADEIKSFAKKCNGILLYSSNFSIGVNMFFKIVSEAARLFEKFPEYDSAVWEMHHNQKVDSPSGTALTLAQKILANTKLKTAIEENAFHEKPRAGVLHVSSTRCGTTPGTHTVFFDSDADTIELTHRARNSEGFARGAVFALEQLCKLLASGKFSRGKVYTTDDIF